MSNRNINLKILGMIAVIFVVYFPIIWYAIKQPDNVQLVITVLMLGSLYPMAFLLAKIFKL